MKKATKPKETPVEWTNSWWAPVVHDKNKTACKHGTGNCEVCGSYNRSNARHSTVGGKGLIARLRK